MIRTCCTGLLLALSLFSSALSPSPSQWEREIFIGADDTHYYTYLVKRTLPGSYYMYTDSTFLNKIQINGDKLVEQNVVRVTLHLDENAEGIWTQKEKLEQAFNVDAYLIKEGIGYAFSHGDLFTYHGLSINNKELTVRDIRQSTILNSEALGKQLKMDWTTLTSSDRYALHVSEYYEVGSTYYFTLQYGYGGDMDYYQDVILVSKNIVAKALRKSQSRD